MARESISHTLLTTIRPQPNRLLNPPRSLWLQAYAYDPFFLPNIIQWLNNV